MAMQGIEKIREHFGRDISSRVAAELHALDTATNALRDAAPKIKPGWNEEYMLLSAAMAALDTVYRNPREVVEFVAYAFHHNESYARAVSAARHAIAMSKEKDEDRGLEERLAV